MAVVYLTHQGATVRREADALIVEADGSKLAELEAHRVDALCIFGRVHLTLPAMELLLQRNIETAFLSQNGRLKGQLTPARPHNIAVRLEQFRRFFDDSIRFDIARNIVRAKLNNACELLQRHQYNNPESGLAQHIVETKDALESVDRATALADLRGFEGHGTRAYFAGLGCMCKGELSFTGRTSRPPKDPFNALLSFGYVLLVNEITHLADAIGLDPYLGFYHEPQDRRASLAVDLVEELRHPLIDRFCLHLNNNRMLGLADFQPDPDEPGGVLMTPDALRRYLREYDGWMQRTRGSRPAPRAIVRQQVERFADWLKGGGAYQPYRFED